MAVFKNGEWGNNKYTVEPLGFRKRLKIGSWTLPYLVGEKVEWKIKITPKGASSKPLFDFDIREDVSPHDHKTIESHKGDKNENILEYDFINERVIARKGRVEYWLGEIGGENSYLLISADVLHGDTVFFVITASVLSSTIVLLLSFLVR